ncbi:hypothetical protein PAPYR_2356 [Paratrimastix pyriformis]|uniref:Uncharacterized protein n=1 Tax=Paratrimastix pyriformis TaxID=342808 RepID=A0ABQ8UQ70_9EUKA|nr:hypothetical protein PAPYR_2356 [Paratrimastix pyriformis]
MYLRDGVVRGNVPLHLRVGRAVAKGVDWVWYYVSTIFPWQADILYSAPAPTQWGGAAPAAPAAPAGGRPAAPPRRWGDMGQIRQQPTPACGPAGRSYRLLLAYTSDLPHHEGARRKSPRGLDAPPDHTWQAGLRDERFHSVNIS